MSGCHSQLSFPGSTWLIAAGKQINKELVNVMRCSLGAQEAKPAKLFCCYTKQLLFAWHHTVRVILLAAVRAEARYVGAQTSAGDCRQKPHERLLAKLCWPGGGGSLEIFNVGWLSQGHHWTPMAFYRVSACLNSIPLPDAGLSRPKLNL